MLLLPLRSCDPTVSHEFLAGLNGLLEPLMQGSTLRGVLSIRQETRQNHTCSQAIVVRFVRLMTETEKDNQPTPAQKGTNQTDAQETRDKEKGTVQTQVGPEQKLSMEYQHLNSDLSDLLFRPFCGTAALG